MAGNRALRAVLFLLFAAALSLLGCAPAQTEMTGTASRAEPTETPLPSATSSPAPTETPPQITVGVAISPVRGPARTEVVAVVTGLPAGTEIELGLGRQGSDYDVVSRHRIQSEGVLTTTVTIPTSAEPGERWVVVAATEDGAAEGVSDVFQVTATPTPIQTPTPSETFLLPDLEVLPSRTIYIEFAGDQRYLRFETSFANVGEADLRLFGKRDPERGVVTAIQTVVTTGGEERSEEIGEFVFHPDHTHWHVENFAQYELWSYAEGEEEELLVSEEKVGFCMFDYEPYDLTLPNAPQERQFEFEDCDEGIQGLSVGWVDTYLADREGQALGITGLPNGRYQLRMIANPAGYMLESSYDNNGSVTVIEISGSVVRILEE